MDKTTSLVGANSTSSMGAGVTEAQFVAGPYPSHFQGMLPQAWQQAPNGMMPVGAAMPPPGWHFASAPAAPPAPASLAPSMAAPRPAAAAYVAAGIGAAAAREATEAAAAAQEDSNAREHDAEQRYYARLRSLVAQGRLPKGVADRIVRGGKSESSIAE